MQATVKSAALEEALQKAPRKVFPYVFAAIRRMHAAYRREFNKSLATKLKRPGAFRIGTSNGKKAPWGFFWSQKPPRSKEKREGNPNDIEVSFHTKSKVAKVLEFGATIRPKRGRMLAIPMGYALTKTGRVKKMFRRPAMVKRGWYLRFDKKEGRTVQRKGKQRVLQPLKTRHGKLYLALRMRGKTANGKPKLKIMFRLVPRVHVKARLGFYSGWDRFGPEKQKRLKSEMDRYMREVWGGKKKAT